MRWSLLLAVGCGRVGFAPVSSDGSSAGACTPAEVRVSNAPGVSQYAHVVWAGDRFAVCWEDERNMLPNAETFCRFLDVDGTPLGPELDIVPVRGEVPAITWTGSELVVAHTDNRTGDYDIYAARYDANGTRLSADLDVSPAIGLAWKPDIQFAGTELAVAWWDERDGPTASDNEVYFSRITPNASAVLSETRVTNALGASYDPSLVALSDGYALAWWDKRNGPVSDGYLARLDATGTKITADISFEDETDYVSSPSLASNGEDLAVAFHAGPMPGNRRVMVGHHQLSGTRVGAPVIISHAGQDAAHPSLVVADGGYSIAWSDNATSTIWFERLGDSSRQISSAAAVADDPVLTWTGDRYGVAWTDARFGDTEIYFALVCP